MTQRARKRYRRSAGSVPRKLLLAFGVLVGAERHPRGGGRDLGAERPSRHATARPAEAGQGGGQLGRVRGRRRPPGLHPVGHDPAPGVGRQDPAGAQPRHGGDRGRALLRARRDRLRGDRARRLGGPEGGRRGPGRLDDHPAARPQPLHRGSRGDDRAEDPRGDLGGGVRAGVLEDADPHQVPEHGLLRDHRRPHRGGRSGRRRDLLLKAGPGAGPARGGADRRAAAGALRVQPVPEPEGRRCSGATTCSRRWRGRDTSPRRTTRRRSRRGWGSTAAASTRPSASPTSSTTSPRS